MQLIINAGQKKLRVKKIYPGEQGAKKGVVFLQEKVLILQSSSLQTTFNLTLHCACILHCVHVCTVKCTCMYMYVYRYKYACTLYSLSQIVMNLLFL